MLSASCLEREDLMTKLYLLASEESPDIPHPQFALPESGDNISVCLVRLKEFGSLGFGTRDPDRISVLPLVGF